MKFKYLFLLAIVALLFSSCQKVTKVTATVQHDINLPAPIVEIADAYVTYYDNRGNAIQELMVDGKFNRSFAYSWEGDQADKNYSQPEYHKLYITLKLKDSSQSFEDGSQLLLDPTAHFNMRSITSLYDDDKLISIIDKVIDLSLPDQYQNHKYSEYEQSGLFVVQDIVPFYSVIFDRNEKYKFEGNVKFTLGDLDGLDDWHETRTISLN